MRAETRKRIDYCCNFCGSREVVRDATARWSVSAQAWELAGVQDQVTCEQCNDDTSLNEIQIPEVPHVR